MLQQEGQERFVEFLRLCGAMPGVTDFVTLCAFTGCPQLILVEGVGRQRYARALAGYLACGSGRPLLYREGLFYDAIHDVVQLGSLQGGVLLVVNPEFPTPAMVKELLKQLGRAPRLSLLFSIEHFPLTTERGASESVPVMRRFREMMHALVMVPLSERSDLAEFIHFLWKSLHQMPARVEAEALVALLRYAWPGDLAELENLLVKIAHEKRATGAVPRLAAADLPQAIYDTTRRVRSLLTTQVDLHEAGLIRRSLQETKGAVAHAADLLGIPERTLRRKMRSYGIAKESFRPRKKRRKGAARGP